MPGAGINAQDTHELRLQRSDLTITELHHSDTFMRLNRQTQ
jgi:copper homeostasis protein CutC